MKSLALPSTPLILIAILLLSACRSPDPVAIEPATTAPAPIRAPIDSLDRDTANARYQRLSEIRYAIEVDLDEQAERFNGKVEIRFQLSDADTPLTVDFGGGEVLASELNDSSAELAYNGHFLTLPAQRLHLGENRLQIRYRHLYSQDGTGLHRFVDPLDGRVYLYSYLWPYYANRVFPAFDQPNLKARFSLVVTAPPSWTVVSMSAAGAPQKVGNKQRWQFPSTPPIASYAFSLHAGPYRIWEADAEGIPLRLMARQSVAEHVTVEEWFETTRRGLRYYADYFQIPYPFGKYDQLLVPDFAIGAMENVAAVTFSEQSYVQRQASNRSERESRAATILHEMAHMWFGDLVTHHWWNGMWLNESFATQMAAMATLATTEFDDTWHGFFTNAKQRAYQADSRVTTHPVEMAVNSTRDFFLVFDAITYQKGASVLKQLAHYVGEENYRRGVSAYLKANAYGNTELADFVSHQSSVSGKDIESWAQLWLNQPGFNSLRAEPTCEQGQLRSLQIIQSAPPAHPFLRIHRVDLALYSANADGGLGAPEVLPVEVRGERTDVSLVGDRPCPLLINPNHDDWTLAQIDLDARSLETLRSRLGAVSEPLARSMFFAALHQRAVSAQDPLAEHLQLTLALMDQEADLRIQQQLADSLVVIVDLMQRLRPNSDADLAEWLPRIEQQALRAAIKHRGDRQRISLDLFLQVVASESGLETLRQLLDGKQTIPGLAIAEDLRWKMLAQLAAAGDSQISARIDAELARNDADFARKLALTARAAIPDADAKSRWLRELTAPNQIRGLSWQRALMSGLFPAAQTDLQLRHLGQILDSLPQLSTQRDPYFMSSYVRTLLQPTCKSQGVEEIAAFLSVDGSRLDATTLRFTREALQADQECLALRHALGN